VHYNTRKIAQNCVQNVQKAFAAGAPRSAPDTAGGAYDPAPDLLVEDMSPTMHSLDRYLASNVCCRKENSFQDCHCIGHDVLANNSNSTKSDIAQKLKKAIFSEKFQ